MEVLQRKPFVDKDGNTYELEYICMSPNGKCMYNFIKRSGDIIDTIECVLLTMDDVRHIMLYPAECFAVLSNIRDNKCYMRIAIMLNDKFTNGFVYQASLIKHTDNMSTNECCYDVCKNTNTVSLGVDEAVFDITGDIYKLYMWVPQEMLINQTQRDQFIGDRAKKYIEEYRRKESFK